ncbi:hypothetical protein XPA_006699 [Xanthoria parietina]
MSPSWLYAPCRAPLTNWSRNLNTTRQLDAGVRLLTAQVHNYNGTWHLCHSDCALLDAGLLSSWLATIKSWLDEHPYDVVSILLVNSDLATRSDLDGEFEAAAITSYAYTPSSTTAVSISWPTLDELIASGKRLITFVADLAPSMAAPYLMDEFTFIFENPYSVTSLSKFFMYTGTTSGGPGPDFGSHAVWTAFFDEPFLGRSAELQHPNPRCRQSFRHKRCIRTDRQSRRRCCYLYGYVWESTNVHPC